MLDFSDNKIKEITKNIFKLEELRILKIQKNELMKLPEISLQCNSLTELDLSSNKLTELKEDIGNLSSLINVNLSKNCLKEIPKSFSEKCEKIRKINLSNNKITKLSNVSWKIKEIDLSGNEINDLNDFLKSVKETLEIIYCNQNKISFLTKDDFQMKFLSEIYCSENKMKSFDFRPFPSLTVLDFNKNLLNKIDPSLLLLTSLKRLDLSNNSLKSLLPEIGLMNLTSFSAKGKNMNHKKYKNK